VEISKDTVLCISVASRPSNFGTTVHNAAYRFLGLDFLYKAFRISEIKGAISGVRALGIRGCSVSMPFKEEIIPELDSFDEAAKSIGAVNAVVNDNGRLTGCNTDAYGAEVALKLLPMTKDDKVLLLGAGGAAKAILYSLRRAGINRVVIANRTDSKSKHLAASSCESIPWNSRHETGAAVIINATSIGMSPHTDQLPLDLKKAQGCCAVMDLVMSPMESLLIRTAKDMGLCAVPGYKMSLHQAAAQFRLYTGVNAPLEVMERSIIRLLQAS
jgi:shikimate dehydrogenase